MTSSTMEFGRSRTVRTRGLPPNIVFVVAAGIVLPVAFSLEIVALAGVDGLLQAILLRPTKGDFSNVVIAWEFLVIEPIVIAIVVLWQIPRELILSDRGIRVRTRLSEFDVPWSDLRPPTDLKPKRWLAFRIAPRTKRRRQFFWATLEQGRAILEDPAVPAHLFPPEVWEKLRITPSLPDRGG